MCEEYERVPDWIPFWFDGILGSFLVYSFEAWTEVVTRYEKKKVSFASLLKAEKLHFLREGVVVFSLQAKKKERGNRKKLPRWAEENKIKLRVQEV